MEMPHPDSFKVVIDLLDRGIEDDLTKDYKIKPNYNAELDELRKLKDSTNELLQELEMREKQKTGLLLVRNSESS